MSDRYGRRPIYLRCIATFALGSLTVALAPSYTIVLVGRVIQGISAGGITPAASAVIGDAFPPAQRGKALGLIGATFGMAFLVGPLVASAMLVALSWQWLFLINLPVAAVILFLGARYLPAARSTDAHLPFDSAGICTVATLLTSLALGITQTLDHLTGLRVWPWLLVLAVLCVPLLLIVERRAAQPIIPLQLFRARQLQHAYVLAIGAGFGMGSVVFISALAVAAFAFEDRQAGFVLFPLVLCSLVGSIGSGRGLQRYGTRLVLMAGFAALALGSALLALFPEQFSMFILATLGIGFGVGVVVGGGLRYIVLAEARAEERTAAQGLVNICISIGNLLSAAVIGAIVSSTGEGVQGFAVAYGAAAIVASGMMALCLGLQGRIREDVSPAQQTEW